jgi:uroporphyrinogen-III synthase
MDSAHHTPLVLLTRPRRESRLAARALAARGIDCIRMPLQSTRRAPQSAALDADLHWAGTADIQIFVSRAAVAAAMASAAVQVRAARIRIAVGRATAAALQQRGLPAMSAPGHAQDSDGVLGLAPLQDVRGTRIAIWAAPGGRERIAEVLCQRGAELRVVAVYRRLPVAPRRSALRRLRSADQRCVLTATSGALLEALERTLQSQRLVSLHAQPLIVASERVAALARTLGFSRVQVARGASTEALIAALDDPQLWS